MVVGLRRSRDSEIIGIGLRVIEIREELGEGEGGRASFLLPCLKELGSGFVVSRFGKFWDRASFF